MIEEAKDKGDLNDFAYYRVEKMRFASAGGREKDKSVLIFNGRITLKNIPPETHEYMVNGKSALEWVMERYEPYTDKDSGIKNEPERMVPRARRSGVHPESGQARDPRQRGDGQDRRRPAVDPVTAEGREQQCPT